MKNQLAIALPVLALLAGLSGTAALSQSAGDPEAGADAFDSYCSDCHSVSPRGLNKKGPTLYRVIGRHAGVQAGFHYSPQMAASGIVWTPEKINAYLANPRAVVPQGTMKFKGLPKAQDRADLIAYLRNPD